MSLTTKPPGSATTHPLASPYKILGLIDNNSMICTYIISVSAANIAEMATYPLDLTKTRLQIQGEIAAREHTSSHTVNAPYRGMYRTALGIVREEGVLRLWQGCIPALWRHVIYSGTRIITYETMRDHVFHRNPDGTFTFWKSVLSGVSAGAFSQFIASPTDLVKVQMMMEGRRRLMGEPPRVNGFVEAFFNIYRRGGIRGLWKGSIPNVQRAALVNMGDLTTYDTAKHLILNNTTLKDDHFTHFLSSACAGLIAAMVGTPADVVKTRVMNQPTDEKGRGVIYKSSYDCLKKTVANEGFFALYKGFLPIWIRLGPWSLIFWISFEEFRRMVGVEQF